MLGLFQLPFGGPKIEGILLVFLIWLAKLTTTTAVGTHATKSLKVSPCSSEGNPSDSLLDLLVWAFSKSHRRLASLLELLISNTVLLFLTKAS